MKKTVRQIIFSVVCVMALASIASCDKDGNETGSSTPSGGNITPAGYVDLGLPSGTKWKAKNETNPNDENNFYAYDEAMTAFGNNLPTTEQFEELRKSCSWSWSFTGKNYKVTGPNGNSISMPAAGHRNCAGDVYEVGFQGDYWSSSPWGSDLASRLHFSSDIVFNSNTDRCVGCSVRLVYD